MSTPHQAPQHHPHGKLRTNWKLLIEQLVRGFQVLALGQVELSLESQAGSLRCRVCLCVRVILNVGLAELGATADFPALSAASHFHPEAMLPHIEELLGYPCSDSHHLLWIPVQAPTLPSVTEFLDWACST